MVAKLIALGFLSRPPTHPNPNQRPPTRKFFMVCSKQKQLNHVRFFLTDRKNRPLGRLQGTASLTAAGPGTAQCESGATLLAIVR